MFNINIRLTFLYSRTFVWTRLMRSLFTAHLPNVVLYKKAWRFSSFSMLVMHPVRVLSLAMQR